MPSATNTGPDPAVALETVIGDVVMSTDGDTLSGKNITGTLYLAANNLTVVDVRAHEILVNTTATTGGWSPARANMTLRRVEAAMVVTNGHKNLVIDHSHFTGVPGEATMQVGYWDSGQHKLTNTNSDGLTVTNSLIGGGQATTSAKHHEALHLMGATHVVLRNNVFDFTPADKATWEYTTAALYMEIGVTDVPCLDVVIDGNWFFGGGYYQVYFSGQNVKVTNNQFHSYSIEGEVHSFAGPVFPPSSNPAGTWWKLVDTRGNTLNGKPVVLDNPRDH